MHQENLRTRVFSLTVIHWLTSSRLTSSHPYVGYPQTLYKPSMKIRTYDAEDIFMFEIWRSANFLKYGSREHLKKLRNLSLKLRRGPWRVKSWLRGWTDWNWHQGVLGRWYEGAASGYCRRNYEDAHLLCGDSEVEEVFVSPDFSSWMIILHRLHFRTEHVSCIGSVSIFRWKVEGVLTQV